MDPAQGGPPRVAFRLAAAQAGLGHEVHLVSYAPETTVEEFEIALANVPHSALVHRHSLEPAKGLERLTAWRAGRSVEQLIDERPTDILHLHNVWEPIVPAAAAAARRRGVPYMILLNGMLHPWSLAQKRWKKRLALALRYRRMLDGAGALHVLNEVERACASALGLKSRPVIIPNGVFPEEIDPLPPRGRFRASYPQLGDRPFILFLSRLHHKKGLDYLADTFSIVAPHVPDLQLVVAGPDGGARQAFEQQIDRLRLRDRVHIIDSLLGVAKLGALVDATVFCLPSRQEGFSLAITEALACGVPVVISRDCNFPEVAEVGAGEVLDLDPRLFADAILRIVGDAELRARMGAAGRKLILSRYTWPRIAEQTIEAYHNICGVPRD